MFPVYTSHLMHYVLSYNLDLAGSWGDVLCMYILRALSSAEWHVSIARWVNTLQEDQLIELS